MNSNQRRWNLIRGVVAVLWLFGFIVATSTVTVHLLYGLPVLALVSFFLADYFSGFVIVILLTLIVKTLYLDQMPGITRAFIIDALWITAIVATGIKLLQPFDRDIVDKRGFAKPNPDYRTPELPLANYANDKLPVSFRHDLQTPISLILGFCNAILRTEQDPGRTIAPQDRDNIQAIYRNAQHLEKMIADLLNHVVPVRATEAEELEIAAVIQEAAALIQDLMAVNGLRLDIKMDDALPRLKLNRITIRQVILNVLRTIARLNGRLEAETTVTVRVTVHHPALHITFTALPAHIHHVITDETWDHNERLLEMIGGRIWVQDAVDPTAKTLSDLILALPLPSAITSVTRHRSILIVSAESSVQDFFEENLNQYLIIRIKAIDNLRDVVAQSQPAAVVLTREHDTSQLPMIGDLVGKQVPIIVCNIGTTQELVEQLSVVYLPKPVSYDALLRVLTNAKFPVTHILIVDDNFDSAEMLTRMLASMSPTFISWKAYLAQDVFALLDEHPISAIILDISLPDMDGIALAQFIRSDARFADVPIVLVSAQQNLATKMPIIVSNRLSIFQRGGFEPNRLASTIDALVNASAPDMESG